MTGFGTSSRGSDNLSIKVEVKSINSKSQDFSFKLPRIFQEKEIEVRTLLSKSLGRGKVSVQIDLERLGAEKPKMVINSALFKAYHEDILKNAQPLGVSMEEALRIILNMPEIYTTEASDDQSEQEWSWIYSAIEEAVLKCDHMRKEEGRALHDMLWSYLQKIETLLEKVKQLDPYRILKIKEKLKSKLEEVIPVDKIDTNRFEQELIYYLERLDIEEEKVRLKTHIDYFRQVMDSVDEEGAGKKLGFIAQEIGREINTIGAKCNDAEIQRCVIEMKEELEKIKEQSLNIL